MHSGQGSGRSDSCPSCMGWGLSRSALVSQAALQLLMAWQCLERGARAATIGATARRPGAPADLWHAGACRMPARDAVCGRQCCLGTHPKRPRLLAVVKCLLVADPLPQPIFHSRFGTHHSIRCRFVAYSGIRRMVKQGTSPAQAKKSAPRNKNSSLKKIIDSNPCDPDKPLVEAQHKAEQEKSARRKARTHWRPRS